MAHAGKCNHLAGIRACWSPVPAAQWAALTFTGPSNAPRGCAWRPQLDATLSWIRAFLQGTAGALCRVFTLRALRGSGQRVVTRVDASPWGLGGVLYINGRASAWCASQLVGFDAETPHHPLGEAEGHQTWAAYTLLVATCAWRSVIFADDVWGVHSGSMSTLSMALQVEARGTGPGLVARALAFGAGIRQHLAKAAGARAWKGKRCG